MVLKRIILTSSYSYTYLLISFFISVFIRLLIYLNTYLFSYLFSFPLIGGEMITSKQCNKRLVKIRS